MTNKLKIKIVWNGGWSVRCSCGWGGVGSGDIDYAVASVKRHKEKGHFPQQPQQGISREAWENAKGSARAEGAEPSEFMKALAERLIAGEISTDQAAEELLKKYRES